MPAPFLSHLLDDAMQMIFSSWLGLTQQSDLLLPRLFACTIVSVMGRFSRGGEMSLKQGTWDINLQVPWLQRKRRWPFEKNPSWLLLLYQLIVAASSMLRVRIRGIVPQSQ